MTKLLITLLLLSFNVLASNSDTLDLSEKDRGYKYTLPKKVNTMSSFGKSSCGEIKSKTINVLVWNMFKGDKPDWQRDFLVLSKNKDLVLMQEVYLDNKMKSTFDKTDYQYVYAKSFIYNKTLISTGVATASRCASIKNISQRSIPLEPIVSTPKMVVITKYKTSFNTDLLVLNIHGINFVNYIKLATQLKQAYSIARHHTGPIIFAGDFNTWSKMKLYVLKRFAKKLNLNEVKFENDGRMKTFGNPLDHVLYRGFKVISSKVHSNIEGSDHKALDIKLEFNSN